MRSLWDINNIEVAIRGNYIHLSSCTENTDLDELFIGIETRDCYEYSLWDRIKGVSFERKIIVVKEKFKQRLMKENNDLIKSELLNGKY